MYCFHKCFLRTWEVLQAPEEKSNEEACLFSPSEIKCNMSFSPLKKKNKTLQKTLYFSIKITKQNLKQMKGKLQNWANLN